MDKVKFNQIVKGKSNWINKAKQRQMQPIMNFLTINGFEQLERNKFKNNKCTVTILKSCYSVTFMNEFGEGTICSDDLNIYWLIGVLTYYNMIDRNYKDLKK